MYVEIQLDEAESGEQAGQTVDERSEPQGTGNCREPPHHSRFTHNNQETGKKCRRSLSTLTDFTLT